MISEALETNEKCLLTELADGTGVLLDLDSKFYYTLNATGVAVWKAIRGGSQSRPEITDGLVAGFHVDRATVEGDLSRVLEVMLREGLVRSVRR